MEEFEKEVDISERAKNFNFRFDEDDDGSLCKENKYTVDLKIVASSMNSQRIDMVEGDEQLNLKGGDMSSDRNTSSIASSLQNVCYIRRKVDELKFLGQTKQRGAKRRECKP